VTAISPAGQELVVGNRALLLAEGVSVAVADAEAARAEERGHTVVFVGLEGRVRAIISLRDEDRLGARAAVQRLIDLGIEVVLVSGDHRGTVEALARHLDIGHVKAELLPDERGAEVRRLRETGGLVAAIGRAGHDDPALGAADVQVVLGAAGASESERAVASTSEDVRDAAAALWLARAARRAAWRGTTAAALGGAFLVALSAGGVVAPAVAAVLALGIDAYALPSAARLLRRIELRLPVRG
ncbi:MAG TPA: HAD family hydrolase, partial [Sandaracinaceae bacterium]